MAIKLTLRNSLYLWIVTTLITLSLSKVSELTGSEETQFLDRLSTDLIEGLDNSALDVPNFNLQYGLAIRDIIDRTGIGGRIFRNPIERIQFGDSLKQTGNSLITIYYTSDQENPVNNALLLTNLTDDQIRNMYLSNDLNGTNRYISLFIYHESFEHEENPRVQCQLMEIFFINFNSTTNEPEIMDSYYQLKLLGPEIYEYGETFIVDMENRQIDRPSFSGTEEYLRTVGQIANDCLNQYYQEFESEIDGELSEAVR